MKYSLGRPRATQEMLLVEETQKKSISCWKGLEEGFDKKPKHHGLGTCWEGGCPRRRLSYCSFLFSVGNQSFFSKDTVVPPKIMDTPNSSLSFLLKQTTQKQHALVDKPLG